MQAAVWVPGAVVLLLLLVTVALSPEALLSGSPRLVPVLPTLGPPRGESELSAAASQDAVPGCRKELAVRHDCHNSSLSRGLTSTPALRMGPPAHLQRPHLHTESSRWNSSLKMTAGQDFLKLTWPWYGQLANQLVTIAKAYVMALEWDRILVLPGLAPSDKHPTARLGFFDIFSRAALERGPVRVLTLAEYNRLGIKAAAERCHRGCWCCRQAPRCDCTVDQPGSAARTLLLDAKSTFLGRKGNELQCAENHSLFRWLQPSTSVSVRVAEQLKLLGPHFVGVHLRKLKPSEEDGHYCLRKLPPISWWYNVVRRIPWQPTALECHMPPALIACFRTSPGQRLFVGSDGKNATAVALLEAAGARRFNPTAEFGTLRAVLVDLFVLAEAEVFLGNPLSTFSGIICSLREAQGRDCPNLLPKLQVRQCQRLPDNTKAFEDYTRAQHIRIANTTYLRTCQPQTQPP